MVDIEKEQEIWKTYPDHTFIEVSNLGRVRTVDHWVTYKNGRKQLYKGHVLKQWDNGHGYMRVYFTTNGKQVKLYVHRMVAICFLPNHLGLPEINHLDNNPKNNDASNLEWCTHEYNISYREKYGVSAAEAFGQLVFVVDLKTGKVLRFETQSEAARQLNVYVGNVSKVIKGELNQTGGYWFTENENEITEEKIREIRASMQLCPVIAINPETSEVFWFKSQNEAARQLNINAGNINSVVKERYKKAGGYWFCNADEKAIEKTRDKFGDEIARKVEELIANFIIAR